MMLIMFISVDILYGFMEIKLFLENLVVLIAFLESTAVTLRLLNMAYSRYYAVFWTCVNMRGFSILGFNDYN